RSSKRLLPQISFDIDFHCICFNASYAEFNFNISVATFETAWNLYIDLVHTDKSWRETQKLYLCCNLTNKCHCISRPIYSRTGPVQNQKKLLALRAQVDRHSN